MFYPSLNSRNAVDLFRFPDSDRIRIALAAYQPLPQYGSHQRRAAVAIILAGPVSDPSLCFILRAQRPNDRWSGDIAFPGGWENPDDADRNATAVRETEEEVGLTLRADQHLGNLPILPITPTGSADRAPIGSVIAASVYRIETNLPTLYPDAEELSDAFWIPVAHILAAANRTQIDRGDHTWPGVRCDQHIIWGLTYRVLECFFTTIGVEAMNPAATEHPSP